MLILWMNVKLYRLDYLIIDYYRLFVQKIVKTLLFLCLVEKVTILFILDTEKQIFNNIDTRKVGSSYLKFSIFSSSSIHQTFSNKSVNIYLNI